MRESADKIVLSVEQESVSLLLETLTEQLQDSMNPLVSNRFWGCLWLASVSSRLLC
jgi:hypothetical protein